MKKMDRPTSILYLLSGAFQSDGGIAALNRLTLHTLAHTGCSIKILSLSESQPKVDDRYFPQDNSVNIRAFNGNKYRFSLAAWKAVLSHRYDLIFVDHVNLASVLAPLSWAGLCRYYVWLCGIEVFAPRPDREGRLGLKYAFGRIAISNYTFENVRERFPNLQIAVCDLALDPILHRAEPAQRSMPGALELESVSGKQFTISERCILHAGRMVSVERYKGQETLLRAMPMIHSQFPETQLVLVGQGDDHERLLKFAHSLPANLQDAIFMPGYVSSDLLHHIYQTCFVFAMPSIGEGFGLVYLEAMARAKPCLGGNVDATPCVVRDGLTGVLVDDPRSYEQVARRLIELLENPQKAYEMGQAGYELVRSFYLPAHFAKRFWNALEPGT